MAQTEVGARKNRRVFWSSFPALVSSDLQVGLALLVGISTLSVPYDPLSGGSAGPELRSQPHCIQAESTFRFWAEFFGYERELSVPKLVIQQPGSQEGTSSRSCIISFSFFLGSLRNIYSADITAVITMAVRTSFPFNPLGAWCALGHQRSSS